jgi:subtilisin family serine protease
MRKFTYICYGLLLLATSLLGQSNALPRAFTLKSNSALLRAVERHIHANTAKQNNTLASDTLLHCAVLTTDTSALRALGMTPHTITPLSRENFNAELLCTIHATPAQLVALAAQSSTLALEAGTTLRLSEQGKRYPFSLTQTGAHILQENILGLNTTVRNVGQGAGAIILVYDSGIDILHEDFRTSNAPTTSRILTIWDQTLTPQAGEFSPDGFSYGVEYTQSMINTDIQRGTSFVRTRDIVGHGTHVAGIAAGTGLAGPLALARGIAPESELIIVKGGDRDFSTPRIVEALTYARKKSEQFGKPIVVNFSLGGHDGAHDGSDLLERAINAFTALPGRAVVCSAGNEGADSIHYQGRIAGTQQSPMRMVIPANFANTAELSVSIWHTGNLDLTAKLRAPDGKEWTCALGASTIETAAQGRVELRYQGSTIRRVSLTLTNNNSTPVQAGIWEFLFDNPNQSTFDYDAWITENTPGSAQQNARILGADNRMTVSVPGNADSAITVAASVSVTRWGLQIRRGSLGWITNNIPHSLAEFSGQGPTRDGRAKPDITAPGRSIVSAMSTAIAVPDTRFILPGGKHYLLTGTSMASPYVAGAVGILLGQYPHLCSGALKQALMQSADDELLRTLTPANIATPMPSLRWGSGALNIAKGLLLAYSSAVHPNMPIAFRPEIRRITAFSDTASAATGVVRLQSDTACAVVWSIAQPRSINVVQTGYRCAGIHLRIANDSLATVEGNATVFPKVGRGTLLAQLCEMQTNTDGTRRIGRLIGVPTRIPFDSIGYWASTFVAFSTAHTLLFDQEYGVVFSVESLGTGAPQAAIGLLTAQGQTPMFAQSGGVQYRIQSLQPGAHSAVAQRWQSASPQAQMRIRPEIILLPTETPRTPQFPGTLAQAVLAPNPSDGIATVRCVLERATTLRITIANVLGQIIVQSSEQASAGAYQRSIVLPTNVSGILFVRIETDDTRVVLPMSVVR